MRNNYKFIFCALAIIALCGCESKEFKAEREMWSAHKSAQAIYKNPKGTPSYQLTKAQDAYRAIIKKYPDSMFAVQSQFSIGYLYVVRGDFQNARVEYNKLVLDCDKKGNLCAEGIFAIGNSYELEGKWADALAQYKKIMQDFPFSTKSFDLPIYIIRHYRLAADADNVKRSLDEAVSYFIGLKSKSKTEKGGYILQGLVARSYVEAGQWQDALDNLEKIVRDYPKEDPAGAILIKAVIYANRLNDKPKAKEELQRIVKEYPHSNPAKTAEAYLKKIQ